jgi:catechol 2,3-dioxygenase-like lactoylglutathione lyase family enzyme
MLADSNAYSGFAVDDLQKAEEFYGETLGLKIKVLDEENGLLQLDLAGDRPTLVYLQPDATPASYTILNFPVEDVDKAVDELAQRGVRFERYDGFEQDEKGHQPRPRAADRLVQGSRRQRALRPPGGLEPRSSGECKGGRGGCRRASRRGAR